MKRVSLVLSVAVALIAPLAGTAQAAGQAPGPVTNVQVLGAALNRVLLTWDAPADPGDKPVSYSVERGGYGVAKDMLGPTTASVTLSGYGAVGLTVVATSASGRSAPVAVSAPARSGDALTVLRPDGKEWISEVAHPDVAMPSSLYPGGAQYQGLWVGNKDGRVRAVQLNGPSYGGDGGPAGSDFTQDGVSSVLYVRPDAKGNPAIVANYFNSADSPTPGVVLRGYTQPTSSGTRLYAVPATKDGPTGAGLWMDRRDGVTSSTIAGTEGATHPAASSDGRWLAYLQPKPGGGQLLRLRTVGQRAVRVLTSPQALTDVTSMSWSPDASTLYVYDDGTHVLLRLPVDPSTGPGPADVIGSGDAAGPALVVSDRILEAYPQWPENGYVYSPRNAGAVLTCRLDGAVLPCNGERFDPATRPGQHNWSLTETIDGRIPITWGYTDITYRTLRDFTGDGKADFAVFRPSTGQWFVRGRPSVQWGERGDVPLTSDFDGDGKVDIAVFRPSTRTWYVKGRPAVRFGGPGDVPVAADYDGDGKDDLAVYRPATHQWFIRGQASIQLGGRGDVPLVGHWPNAARDARERPAVCRPGAQLLFVLGRPSVPTGACGYPDIATDVAYDQIPGFSSLASRQGSTLISDAFGTVSLGRDGDLPVLGDYNGNAAAELVVFRPSSGQWFMRGHSTTQFGGPGDVPL